jgi:hypothetical protein
MAARKSRELADYTREPVNVWDKSNMTTLLRRTKQTCRRGSGAPGLQKTGKYQIINELDRWIFLHRKGLHGIPSTSDSGLPMALSAGKR